MKSFLKRIIPSEFVRFVREKQLNASLFFIKYAHKSRVLSGFYYVFSGGFSSEHQAVLKGRQAYYDSLKNIGETCALLRRNTVSALKSALLQNDNRV